MEEVILHIGTEKTGTTTLQATLEANRARLLENGFLYPKSVSTRGNHIALTAYSLDESKIYNESRIVTGCIEYPSVAHYRRDVSDSLGQEISLSPADKIVFSNEHLSSGLRTDEEIQNLKGLVSAYSDNIKVIIYLRHPVEYVASWYSTAVTAGRTEAFPSPVTQNILERIDYGAMLDRWSAVFGREALVVRRFGRRYFQDGDLLRDFCCAIGAPDLDLAKITPRNESLSAEAILFLREFNKHVPRIVDNRMNVLRGQIVDALRSIESSKGFLIPRSDANIIIDEFNQKSLESVRRYLGLPDDEEIFEREQREKSGDDHAPPESMSFEEAVEIAAKVWTHRRQRDLSNAASIASRKPSRDARGHGTARKPEPHVVLARALWRLSNQSRLVDKTFEERDRIWSRSKDPYLKKAKDLVRILGNEGIELTDTE